jgi:hypothetical protein
VGDEVEQSLIGPVEVLEEQDDRIALGQALEQEAP